MKLRYLSAAVAASIIMIGCEPTQQTQQPLGDDSKPGKSPDSTPQAQNAVTPATPTTPAPQPLPIEPPAGEKQVNNAQPAPTPVAPPELKKDVTDPVTPTPYPAESKDEFVASADKRLADIDQSITKVGDMIANLQADATARQTIETLREQRLQLTAKYDELKQASQDTWSTLKTGFDSAIKDLEKACDEAKAKYVEK